MSVSRGSLARRRSVRALVACAWATVGLLSVVAPARAQVATSDKALAEALFRDARQLSDAGKLADACPKFAESYRIDPKIGTLVNLATCHEQEGKTASAWAEFTEAASLAERAQQRDRQRFARQHADALARQLAQLTLAARSVAEGLEVKLDGRALGVAALGTPFPVDPGDHTVEASAPHRKPWTGHATVAPGPGSTTVDIPALEDEAPPPPPAPPLVVVPPPVAPAPPPPSSASSVRVLGIAAIGVGVAGIAVGSIFGLRTLSEKHDGDALCVGAACTAAGLEDENQAHASATLSTVGFIAGGAMAAVGLILVVASGPSSASHGSLRVAPMVGAGGGAGGLVSGTF